MSRSDATQQLRRAIETLISDIATHADRQTTQLSLAAVQAELGGGTLCLSMLRLQQLLRAPIEGWTTVSDGLLANIGAALPLDKEIVRYNDIAEYVPAEELALLPDDIACVPLTYDNTVLGALWCDNAAMAYDTMAVLYLARRLAEVLYLQDNENGQSTDNSKAKSDFLSRVSHELKTPINAIIGLNHIALAQCSDTECKKVLTMVGNSAGQLSSLVERLLTVSELENEALTLKRQPFALSSALHDLLVSYVDVLRGKHITPEISIADNIPDAVIGDREQLLHIIGSLFDNAVKYTEDGGTVWLLMKSELVDSHTMALTVEISDNGIGITPTYRKKLFELFEQADGSATRKHGGVGLGMALSHRLVKLMHGTLSVMSKVDVGSAFTLTVQVGLQTNSEAMNGDALIQRLCDRGLCAVRDSGGHQALIAQITAADNAPPVAQANQSAEEAMIDAAIFDVQKALTYVKNKETVLVTLVRSFLSKPYPAMLTSDIDAANWQGAAATAGMMKGLTENLSFNELRDSIEVLESQLKSGYCLQDTMNDVQACMTRAVEAAQQYLKNTQ